MKKIVIIGASGHAKVVADIIFARKKELNEEIEIVAFLDDNYENLGYKEIFEVPIIGTLKKIEDFDKGKYWFVIGVGNNHIRQKIFEQYSKLNYYTAVHPKTNIAKEVSIGAGTVIMANVIINAYSTIGKQCILNTSSIIEHDNVLKDYVHVSSNAVLCGEVSINNGSWIGAGSVVKQQISIGENVMIGAGTVIIRDVEDNCTIVGNPGRIIKKGAKNV
mgnify:FL=1|jgi:sugar O-acyltransferase, sialic acid O-acetyltransferase neuD family